MDTTFLEDQIMCFVFALNYIFLDFPSSKSKIFPWFKRNSHIIWDKDANVCGKLGLWYPKKPSDFEI